MVKTIVVSGLFYSHEVGRFFIADDCIDDLVPQIDFPHLHTQRLCGEFLVLALQFLARCVDEIFLRVIFFDIRDSFLKQMMFSYR